MALPSRSRPGLLAPMLGKMLGPYRIESELGSGGMGAVWLAEAVERCAVPAGTRVALKVVHPHLLSEPGFFKRFLREAEIGKAVTHPNVVRCFDADAIAIDGTQQNFLVMEYVEGQTLRDLLDELETVPEELCRHIGREVSKGLTAIHEAGVVHRDLKPENVLITPEHEVKVMDLGVARLADEAIRLSMSGAFVGSVRYASPEQFKGAGEDLDGRADLFALGVILYELACGAHPHPGDDFASVLAKVVEEKPRRLGERNPQLSAFFEEVVHALLAKDRKERFASGSKLLEILEQGEKSTWWGQRTRTLRAETKRPLRRIRIPRETAVYGREEELGKLRALYEKAKDGDGQVVMIEGEAGIGKTRLVDELVGRLQQDGEDLNFLFGSYPPGGAATASGAWSTAYREQFGDEGSEPWLAGAPALVPAFDALLKGEPLPAGEEPLNKASIHEAFTQATVSLARERTTIVLIEDLHFSPEEGRALFAALGVAAPAAQVLLVGTARPGLPDDWIASLERHENATRIPLNRLGPKDLARLLKDAFHSERLAIDLGHQIAIKSDGNPFFIFEIIRGLCEGQLISRKPNGTWTSTQEIREILIPSSVANLIQARISGLGADEQELLDVAACCGFEFDPVVVADVLEMSAIPALRALGRMEKAHRLVRAAGESFIFDHHQVQETLYAGMSDPLKRRYHAAIGEVLERGDGDVVWLCEHFLRGGKPERARPHLVPALDHLAWGYQVEQATALARRALEIPGHLEGNERVDTLLRLDAWLYFLGRIDEKLDVLAEAREVADRLSDERGRARVWIAQGNFHGDLEERQLAVSCYERAITLAEAGQATAERGDACRALAMLDFRERRESEALDLLEQALAAAVATGDVALEARVTGNAGLVLGSLGRFEEARQHHERDHRLEIEKQLPGAGARGAANLADICRTLGDMTGALRYIEYYSERVEARGFRPGQALARAGLGIMRITLGDLDDAEQYLESAMEIFKAILPTSDWAADTRYWLGRLHWARGETDRAEENLRAALDLWEVISDPHEIIGVKDMLGEIASKTDRQELALELHREALELSLNCAHVAGQALSSCRLASLGEGTLSAASKLLTANASRIAHILRMTCHHLLFHADGGSDHLKEAHRLLRHLVDHAPEEYRETMITNVPLHRDIMAAWEEHGGAAD